MIHLIVVAIILLPVAYWFLIKECKRADKAHSQTTKQHKASEVTFTKEEIEAIGEQIDLRMYEFGENPFIAN